MSTITRDCPTCKGARVHDAQACPTCQGKGRITVHIPEPPRSLFREEYERGYNEKRGLR